MATISYLRQGCLTIATAFAFQTAAQAETFEAIATQYIAALGPTTAMAGNDAET
jgi:hypothetical protein